MEELFRQEGIFDLRTATAALPLDQIVNTVAKLPLVYQPGTVWSYSISHLMIGYLVSLLAEMPFDEFVQKRVFEPLGMVDTGFWVPPEKHERLASLYYHDPEAGQLSLVDALPDSPFTRPPIAPADGEGLVSTLSDCLRFARMLLNGGVLDGKRVLSRKTVELMTTNHLPTTMLPFSLFPNWSLSGYGYGLGVYVLMDRIAAGQLATNGSYEYGGAAGTCVFIDPQEELISLVMSQAFGGSLPQYTYQFQRLVYAAIQ